MFLAELVPLSLKFGSVAPAGLDVTDQVKVRPGAPAPMTLSEVVVPVTGLGVALTLTPLTIVTLAVPFTPPLLAWTVFVFVPVGMFFVGLALWLCGKLVEARETLGQAVMVAAYASVPRLLEAVLTAVQGLLLDPSSIRGRWSVSIGPARFLDPDTTSPVQLTLVGRVDLFVIWSTVLLAIGLAVTGRVPRSRAALAAGMVWLLGAVPPLLQALR